MSNIRPGRAGNSIDLAVAALFAATILLSAFLLFQVQPLLSKCILPWFGGSPAVWTTCMLFFQVMLFAGYLYAHLLSRYLPQAWQPIVHLAFIVLAVAITYPTIAPSAVWKPSDARSPTLLILELLTATVALPYFVLSTTGPLVQAWFARRWPGRSPYRLYALSNFGSLAALLSYPFVVEPAIGTDTQAALWTGGFVLFAILCGTTAWTVFRRAGTEVKWQNVPQADAPQAHAERSPSAIDRLLWIGLPACASLMLLATTNYVCQDVAVIPFLWVVPLSLYLLTFIICFDHPRWFRRRAMSLAAIALLVLSAGGAYALARIAHFQLNFLHYLALYFSTMFMSCMVCHGQVVRLRPAPRYLTEYYLLISLGGAMGGIFVGVVAPVIFTTHFEWTLALAASLLVATSLWLQTARWKRDWPARFDIKGGATIVAGLATYLSIPMLCGGIYWISGDPNDADGAIYRNRNFYGTVSVWELNRDHPDMQYRSFVSGSTPHGRQYVLPEKRREPISYFAPHTGIGRTLKFVQNNKPNIRVGIVGMGVGVVAAYARPGDCFRFYEINDQVADIARNYFTYLNDCQGKCEVVLADARLALEHELAAGNPQRFDVLMLDAFSGDSVPAHLLTDEAFAVYLQHLQPDGVIVVNITNRCINLAPVMNAVAKKYGLSVTRTITEEEPEKLLYHTDFVMLSRNQAFLSATSPVLIDEYLQPDFEVPVWTDKFSNLFNVLKH